MSKKEITAEQFAARMKDRDPAFPIVVPGDAMFEDSVIVCGLTKREYAAIHLAAALIANPGLLGDGEARSELAVRCADALLAALERKPE